MLRQLARTAVLGALALLAGSAPALAQAQGGRVLGKEDIRLYGIGLEAAPAAQTVPKDVATVVSTFLKASGLSGTTPAPFAPDAEVRATLRGPSLATPLELAAKPNSPFSIPALSVPGTHTLENIRLVSGGEVLLYAEPESVRIEVIEKLLVTTVSARPLTADEIRQRGIVFDRSSYQAYDFTAAFAVAPGQEISINFPVVLPTLDSVDDAQQPTTSLPNTIEVPPLRTLATIIPDTLKIQAQIPNLSVVGFQLKVPQVQGQNLVVPPIPGVVVIPGDIGYLNQFFSVLLMVANVAPDGSNLSVTELTATIKLPAGADKVVGSPDDPLQMARDADGETPRVVAVSQPGPDGQLGTADDVLVLGPGEKGSAEFLVEGRREGSHVVEMELAGVLQGLPVGPVPIRGRAAGAVLVRNPTFTLTFTHPEVVSAGEPYTLDVTVTNTSASPANFVSVNLFGPNMSGAILAPTASNTQQIDSIAPGDSATVSFDLIATISGRVTAATLDSDENVSGRFALKTSVGERGVPLTPDSLVLPREASSLVAPLRAAALGLLGKAYAVATAPGAALPADVLRFSRQIVWDRAVETAEAGFRVALHEAPADSAAHLWMDFAGNNYARIDARVSDPALRDGTRANFVGFDDLRRRSVRGEVFAAAVAGEMAETVQQAGPLAFHQGFAERMTFRPGHVSVLVAGFGGPVPVDVVIRDAAGRRTGLRGPDGTTVKEVPFSDRLAFGEAASPFAELGLVAVPDGDYVIELHRRAGMPDGARVAVSLVIPGADGTLRRVVWPDLALTDRPVFQRLAGDPHGVAFELRAAAGVVNGGDAQPAIAETVADPAPSLVGVVQQAQADSVGCSEEAPVFPGRVVAVLFSEEVTPETVQDRVRASEVTKFAVDGNAVVGVALQPGRRIAFLALRDPIGPYVPRSLTVAEISDARGNVMPAQTQPIEITVGPIGAVVSGRVLNAQGQPVPLANIRLFYELTCGDEIVTVGISQKPADAQGAYAYDYVLSGVRARLAVTDPDTGDLRELRFSPALQGQRLNVDVVFVGRGTIEGRTLDEAGAPLAGARVKATSLTDQSEYGAVTDAEGRYRLARVPVGNVLIEAVHVPTKSRSFQADLVPTAGAVVTRDLVLLSQVQQGEVVVKYGKLFGHVLRADGVTPVGGVPVYAYYRNRSQAGVRCPPASSGVEPAECPVAAGVTAADGAYSFDQLVAGSLRLVTFDEATYQQGEISVILPASAALEQNVLLVGGLGTVTGTVVDPGGAPVAGARVGGGLSLATTDANGEFTLIDVPVGRREVVAVSDSLGARGSAVIDLIGAGATANVTIVLDSVASIAGVVKDASGAPQANVIVYALRECGGSVCVDGQAMTNGLGQYRIDGLKMGTYSVSAFLDDFSDGNIVPVTLSYFRQVARGDVTFRGATGRVTGRVLAENDTPLAAMVGISGERVVVAGGRVAVKFQYVQNYKVVQTNPATGAFAFDDVWVGPFTLRAAGQFSPDPVSFEGTIATAGQTVDVTLKLQPTSSITGRVFDPDGVTPVGAGVVVNYKSAAFKLICTEIGGETQCDSIPQGIQELPGVTNDRGEFTFPLVNPGPFTLTVEDRALGRSATANGSVRAGETADLGVRLRARADVVVRVIAADRDAGNNEVPIANALVFLSTLDTPRRTIERQAGGVGPETGVARFAGGDAIDEGQFVVVATDPATGFSGRGTGTVTSSGDPVTVTVALYNQSGSVSGMVLDGQFAPVPNAEVVISNAKGPIAFSVTGPTGASNNRLSRSAPSASTSSIPSRPCADRPTGRSRSTVSRCRSTYAWQRSAS